MANEPTQWQGSDAQRQRVAMLREMHLQPRTLYQLQNLPFSGTYRTAVRDLVNEYGERGCSVWREPYPEERYRT